MSNDTQCSEARSPELRFIDVLDEMNESMTQLNSLLTMIVGDDGFDAFEILSRTPKMGYIWTCARLARSAGEGLQNLSDIRDEIRTGKDRHV